MKKILYITMENGRRLTKPSSIKEFLKQDEECMINYTENGEESFNLATTFSGETVLIGDEEFTIDGDDEMEPVVNESLKHIIKEETNNNDLSKLAWDDENAMMVKRAAELIEADPQMKELLKKWAARKIAEKKKK